MVEVEDAVEYVIGENGDHLLWYEGYKSEIDNYKMKLIQNNLI